MKRSIGISVFMMAVFVIPVTLTPAQTTQDTQPEFFGIYAKLTDGTLVEILEHQPKQYRSFVKAQRGSFRDNDIGRSLGAFSDPPKHYLRGVPNVSLRLSEVEGFYVYGDFDLSQFSLVALLPLRLQPGEVLVGDSDAAEIRRGGNYYDTKIGLTIADFQYVERQPKMYWLQTRKPLHRPKGVDGFLAFKFTASSIMDYGKIQYWPFALSKEEHQE